MPHWVVSSVTANGATIACGKYNIALPYKTWYNQIREHSDLTRVGTLDTRALAYDMFYDCYLLVDPMEACKHCYTSYAYGLRCVLCGKVEGEVVMVKELWYILDKGAYYAGTWQGNKVYKQRDSSRVWALIAEEEEIEGT